MLGANENQASENEETKHEESESRDAYSTNRQGYGSPRIHAVLKERRGCIVGENGWPDSCANVASARNPGAEK